MHFHHITLTVVDKEASVEWYQKLFGEASYRGHNGPKAKELDYCLLTFKVTGEPVVAESCNE